jgi:hypothetical protein
MRNNQQEESNFYGADFNWLENTPPDKKQLGVKTGMVQISIIHA